MIKLLVVILTVLGVVCSAIASSKWQEQNKESK